MAKELPYFKFNAAEWISGEITLEDLATQGAFINICAYYWFKSGCLTLTEIKRRLKLKQSIIDSLTAGNHIKVEGDQVEISFLKEQFNERGHISKINSENGSKGGAPKGNKNAEKNNREQPKTSNIEENKNREEKEEKREEQNNSQTTATKVATIESRSFVFMERLTPFVETYGKEMLREFFNYWTETNPNGKKMRFEMQKVFQVERRLITWAKNLKQNGRSKSGTLKDGFDSIDAILARERNT